METESFELWPEIDSMNHQKVAYLNDPVSEFYPR